MICYLFTNGKFRSIRNLKNLLEAYEKSYGQKINFDKSGSMLLCGEHIVAIRPHAQWTGIIWNLFISQWINAFMWRLFSNALSVDAAIQNKGVMLASQCCCCSQPRIETLHHFFVSSDLASAIWNHFSLILQLPYQASSIRHFISVWLVNSSRRSQLGITILGYLFCGCWEIWKERCRIKFEESTPNIQLLLKRIYGQLYELNARVIPKRSPSTWESTTLDIMRIPVRRSATKRGKWLVLGVVKMNTYYYHYYYY